jgi:hypothetical protein
MTEAEALMISQIRFRKYRARTAAFVMMAASVDGLQPRTRMEKSKTRAETAIPNRMISRVILPFRMIQSIKSSTGIVFLQ